MIWWEKGKLFAKINADEEALWLEDQADDESLELSKGDWVVVMFDTKKYPGEVTNIINKDNIEVSVMHETRTSNMYKWPDSPDCLLYNKKDSF
ncbi:hypothetical protein JTE90_029412 [Oedothorax gibbosus]|uniref:Uncharacterized protein n=1 Tax=Oedothorax gibbosus TaxID=931172 RepID=A0AAV6TRB2_9ARAC|nr:hypothetical protein JTE90_029412 [Oedothorax gibbosus]